MAIVRAKEFYRFHKIHIDDVLRHGLEKACILGNLDKYPHISKEILWECFPYIKKKEFYKLLEQLILDGEIKEEDNA